MTTSETTKSRPILFSGEMVRAILSGSKTQTRRILTQRNSTVLGYPGSSPLWAHLHFDHPMGCHKDRGSHIFGCGPDCEYLHVPAWHPDEPEEVVQYRVRSVNRPGDTLWVKETFQSGDIAQNDPPGAVYRATDPDWENVGGWKWKPSIFMRRSQSRITLEVESVRVERLQDISEADAIAEGVDHTTPFKWRKDEWQNKTPNIARYAGLWELINGAGSWDRNPWVWVISFKRITP